MDSMIKKLYHSDVYMPHITFKDMLVKVEYWPHAIKRADEKNINVSGYQYINLKHGKLIELETVNNQPSKIVMRYKYNTQYDIILVILVNGLQVKTVWLNSVSDKHDTLDASKYYKPKHTN